MLMMEAVEGSKTVTYNLFLCDNVWCKCVKRGYTKIYIIYIMNYIIYHKTTSHSLLKISKIMFCKYCYLVS